MKNLFNIIEELKIEYAEKNQLVVKGLMAISGEQRCLSNNDLISFWLALIFLVSPLKTFLF